MRIPKRMDSDAHGDGSHVAAIPCACARAAYEALNMSSSQAPGRVHAAVESPSSVTKAIRHDHPCHFRGGKSEPYVTSWRAIRRA